MPSFEHCARSARQKSSVGKYKEAALDYREAINLLSFRIQQTMGNNELRNKYVQCRNTLNSELQLIEQDMLPLCDQIRNAFKDCLRVDSESPPADPPCSSSTIFQVSSLGRTNSRKQHNTGVSSRNHGSSAYSLPKKQYNNNNKMPGVNGVSGKGARVRTITAGGGTERGEAVPAGRTSRRSAVQGQSQRNDSSSNTPANVNTVAANNNMGSVDSSSGYLINKFRQRER